MPKTKKNIKKTYKNHKPPKISLSGVNYTRKYSEMLNDGAALNPSDRQSKDSV